MVEKPPTLATKLEHSLSKPVKGQLETGSSSSSSNNDDIVSQLVIKFLKWRVGKTHDQRDEAWTKTLDRQPNKPAK